MLMSFLGSMGNLMNCSGLEKAFEEVYSEDTIKHIFWGHAEPIARVHILAQSALVNHISNTSINEGNLNVSGLESFYRIAMENVLTKEHFTDVSNNDAFVKMVNAIKNYSKKCQKNRGQLNCGFFILNTFTLSKNLQLQKKLGTGIYTFKAWWKW